MYRDRNIHETSLVRAGLWLCIVGLLLCLAGPAAAVDPNEAAASDSAVVDPNQPQVTFSDGAAHIDFMAFKKDSNIREGLGMLTQYCHKNIVPSAGVNGALTITRLYDVTFEQALDAILGNGYKYEQDGNFVRVYTDEEYKKIKEDPERMIYKTFTLYYISAAEAKKLVTPLLSGNARVETTSAADTSFSSGESISVTTGGGDSTAQNDTLLIYDYPERIEQATDLIAQIDVRPMQVLVEATILAATLTEDSQFGIDWQSLSGAITNASTGNLDAVTSLGELTDGHPDYFGSAGTGRVALSGGLKIGFTHENIAAFIKAVETVSDVTILANPKILAVNKQLGQVYIGKKLGYLNQTTQTQTSTTQSVSFLDTGTKLSFRPYIGNDGYIRMDIHPKDSSGNLRSEGESGSVTIPDETAAELVTNIIVKDGETIVIGGMFRDKITSARTQVPLLGNLPVVGAVFRGTADQTERQEVMVLLTPHIVKEPSQAGGKDRAEDVRRKVEGATKALQGIDRPRLAEDAYNRAAKYYLEGNIEKAVFNVKLALIMRPTYLEARRLKERIMAETDPEAYKQIDSLVQDALQGQEAENWQRW
jgi:type IV pilus assembly protein PilQ